MKRVERMNKWTKSCTGYSMIKQSRMNERVDDRPQSCTGYSMNKHSDSMTKSTSSESNKRQNVTREWDKRTRPRPLIVGIVLWREQRRAG